MIVSIFFLKRRENPENLKQCFSEKKTISEKSLSQRSISQDVFSNSQCFESQSAEIEQKRKAKAKYTSIDPQGYQNTETYIKSMQRTRTRKRDCKQHICEIHHKELDMICEEECCQIAVCSSCILFGGHKNHKYSQRHKFYENIDTVYNNIRNMEIQIKKKRKATESNHESKNVLPQLRENHLRMKNVVESYFKKSMKLLMRRKKETLHQMENYYEEVGKKMMKYSDESRDLCKWTDKWADQSNMISKCLDKAPRKIENCFVFLGKIRKNQIFLKGQNILDNLNQLQSMLDNKLAECLKGFDIKALDKKNIKNHIPTWQCVKKEISFKNDLSQKLKMWGQSKDSLDLDLPHNVALEIPEFIGSSGLFGDSFDPSSTNLMSGLNLLNEKVKKNQFDFSQNDSPLISKPLTQRETNVYNSRNLNLQRSSLSKRIFNGIGRESGCGINIPKFCKKSKENTPDMKRMTRFCSNDKMIAEQRISVLNYGIHLFLKSE